MKILRELKRRNVLRVGAAYIVMAWLVIQVIETIFPIFGISDNAIRVVITILVIGLLATLVFAWVFELTTEGLRKEKDVDRSASGISQIDRKLDRLIIVVLALALVYFAVDKFLLSPTREAQNVEFAVRDARTDVLLRSYGPHWCRHLDSAFWQRAEPEHPFPHAVSRRCLRGRSKFVCPVSLGKSTAQC